jgi:phosphatidylserine decarboxylase
MATEPTTAARRSAPITSIQPGGGLGFTLESLWARGRRACLRRFWPGYSARMLSLRQGECPACPHDPLDPRDLKLVRNVCGYHFGPEQDPFARPGWLPLARPGHAEILLCTVLVAGLATSAGLAAWWVNPLFWVPVGLLLALWLFVLAFFRDPERAIPADPDLLVSPADGTITQVEEVADPDYPDGRALRVSIFLSVFNVHVNRVPRPGQVQAITYYPGRFLDARTASCAQENEMLVLDLLDRQTGQLIRTKQIAGAIARRIVCWLRPGEEVAAGQRYGMIKFGSRTDVLVPPGAVAEVLVRVGDKVHGGSQPLLRLR